jgi:hypothetical protein
MPTAAQRSYHAIGSKTRLFREAASNASTHGDLQRLDASGNVVALIASGATFDTTTGTLILGQIGRNGNNTTVSTTKNCPIDVWNVDTIVCLPIWSATPANAEQADLLEGVRYGIKNIGGIYAANMDVTGATGVLICLGKYQGQYASTDQFPMAFFKVDPVVLAFKS